MVLLPALVFSSQIEGARVLQVGRQHNCLVSGFSGELNSEVPSIQSNEDKVEILGRQVLGSKRVESSDGIPKSTGIPNMFPCQSR